MGNHNLIHWVDHHSGFGRIWYVKRLSGNDTLANGTHQAGPYVPKDVLFFVFPGLYRPEDPNPDVWFDLHVDSHSDERQIRAVWYNNKLHNGTRNEARLTNFGGISSPLLNPDNTGALAIFVFATQDFDASQTCHAWVCRNPQEESYFEDRVGVVDPGRWCLWPETPEIRQLKIDRSREKVDCWMTPDSIPADWMHGYPTGQEIIEKTVELGAYSTLDPDRRLLKRRVCEYEIFRSLEEAIELPIIRAGFNTIDEFTSRAQSILQRRKARSGRSLELHARQIFIEVGMREEYDFSHGPESEKGKKPDFLFPSRDAYTDLSFPASQLRMLAVKTTCRDRWRQILNEADRIPHKHLLTLQEGVSANQFREMKDANVQLVVPKPLFKKYPEEIRPELMSVQEFIGEVCPSN